MTGESTDSTRDTTPPELDDREVLFNAYLDGELSEEREAEFDERLANDPEFREAYDDFAEVVDNVRNLPYEFAPDDFTDNVRDRIHRRSRGGFFSDHLLRHQRAPYEVVAVVMFIVMASAYLFFLIPSNRDIESTDENRLDVPSRPEAKPADDREAGIDE